MAGETISFAELFERQNAAPVGLRFTAQQIPGDSEHVTITPVDGAGGCRCASALVVPVASVAALSTTDDLATCCGKRLQVVEIEFADGALAAVVGQVHARAAAMPAPGQRSPDPFGRLGMPGPGRSTPGRGPTPAALSDEPTTQAAWPDLGCVARWLACLAVCGGYDGCANICYEDYVRCSGG